MPPTWSSLLGCARQRRRGAGETRGDGAGRKPKAKAPLPPAENRCTNMSSMEDPVEPTAVITEQNENMIDKDIELSVVLPGDIIKSTTVPGSKPMMDLLIFLCGQYHLNPSSHTIDLLTAEKTHIKFKPNTPIGLLEVEQVILKPKTLDKKKPTPIIPEKTVRVVINFKKTQKTIVRVSPYASLQELAPIICSKCEFDPLHTMLLKDYQSQELLDVTKSLNDLGLRELYAMDINRAPSVTTFSKSSLQESCQMSPNLDIMKEKENKGFFSFFQRSKKKREQTASAPATPLINKHRPPSFTRSNTISKPYVSNTLPSDVPKKRRAPLPPMPAPNPEKPPSSLRKSSSMDDSYKSSCEAGMVRTGSLPRSGTPGANASLKRTKRRAPSPPSKTALQQSDDGGHVTALRSPSVDGATPDSAVETHSPSPGSGSLDPGLPSHEQCTVPKLVDETSLSEGPGTPEAAVASLTSGISSDYSLEEIDEKEETQDSSEDQTKHISLTSPGTPLVSADRITIEREFRITEGEASHGSKETIQDPSSRDGQVPHSTTYGTSNEDMIVDNGRNLKSLGQNQENSVQNEIMVTTTNTDDHVKNRVRRTGSMDSEGRYKDVDLDIDTHLGYSACRTDNLKCPKESHLTASPPPDQTLNQLSAAKTKMQDAAIQATPPNNSVDGTHQSHHLSDIKVDESVQTSSSNKLIQHSSVMLQDSRDTSREFRSQSTPVHSPDRLVIKDHVCAYGSSDILSPVDGADRDPASYLKNFPLYKQDSNPKPKPSNEITREYIPKIGMTTYKIVPPKSLEILKDWESETTGYKDDQKIAAAGQKHTPENMKEGTTQTEDCILAVGSREPQPNLTPKPSLRTEPQLHRTVSAPGGAVTSPLKPPRVTRDTGTIPFAPNLEDINNILQSKFKSRPANPHAKPSSFFLQMQKRVSGHYVTSAAAKSVHTTPSPVTTEQVNKDLERNPLFPPEQISSPLSETAHPAPVLHLTKTGGYMTTQKSAETSPPPIAPKPAPIPGHQATALNLKTLKTFGAPRPYSSSAPSPFALAVVKRSQSFSKPHSESTSGEPSAQQPPVKTKDEKACPVMRSADTPCHDEMDKQSKTAHNGQNSQIPSPANCPSFTLKRQSSLTFQSSEPEQIRQSLLTAIRSGEAAAKLKKVTVPPNTVSVNGKSRLSHVMPSIDQDGP
uniref:cordon-bleu protein-like 1 isoform X2 n=1 Tax=Jaculus jaculus TaxID=51337 RepID=UPI001E1B54FF|nr:cordon-bleu protein-like 1 isoform X2 [Jaculus jaculus]